jgi:hypothetical protein
MLYDIILCFYYLWYFIVLETKYVQMNKYKFQCYTHQIDVLH